MTGNVVRVTGPAPVRGGPSDGEEWPTEPVSGYRCSATLEGVHWYRLQRKAEFVPTTKGGVTFWSWEYWYERTDPWPDPPSRIQPSSST